MASNFDRGHTITHRSADVENHAFQHPLSKDVSATGRKRLGQKQAFGELSNVIHNKILTPRKTNIRQDVKPSPLIAKGTNSKEFNLKTKSRKATYNMVEPTIEFPWSEKSVLSCEEIDNMLEMAKRAEKKKKEENWSRLKTDLPDFMKEMDKMYDDLLPTASLNNLNLDNDEICITVPELPKDNWDCDDFFNW